MAGVSNPPSALLAQLVQGETSLGLFSDGLVNVRLVADAEDPFHTAQRQQQLLGAGLSPQNLDVDSERQVLCPITILPDDLLVAALRCLHDNLNATSGGNLYWYARWTQAVICFSSVCKRWRAFALGSPSLWSRIFVNLTAGQGSRRLLDLQLRRSGEAPLDLWIYNQQSVVYDRAFQNILEHSARWRTFSVLHHPRDDDILRCFQIPTPLLESFAICSQTISHLPGDCFPPGPAVDFLPYAPRLRELSIDTCAFQYLSLPRPSLRHVELGYCHGASPVVAFDVLAGCPSLQEADVHTHVPSGFSLPSDAPHVTMTHLTELFVGLDLLLACTGKLSLPALQSLTIHGYRCDSSAEVIFQSLPHILTLHLFRARAGGADGRLLALLAPLTALESLHLDGFSFTHDDFAPLAATTGPGACIAPALTRFKALNAYMDDAAAAACVRFVRSRTVEHGTPGTSPACVRLAHASVHGYGSDGVLDRLRSALSSICGPGDPEPARRRGLR